ncbi:MAG: hypothetical protein K1X57_00920, partial [Gemmataceae bacterium]|nr:hypothetical protein [Gemmataceae bacterium]
MHWWRVVRPVLALAIVVGVAWHLTRLIQTTDLSSLADHWRGDRIAASAGLYVVAIVCWGMYFARLVRRYEPGPLAPILRAYLISHVGKYVPGRALVMVVRSAVAYQWNVPVVISVAMTVYETLVSMAGGALVAAGLASLLDGAALGRALILFAIAAVPIIPGFFDRLALRAMQRFLPAGHAPPPRLTFRQLLEGLLWAAAGAFFLGLALAQLLAGVLADPPGFSPHTIGAIVGVYAFAHVSGFL